MSASDDIRYRRNKLAQLEHALAREESDLQLTRGELNDARLGDDEDLVTNLDSDVQAMEDSIREMEQDIDTLRQEIDDIEHEYEVGSLD